MKIVFRVDASIIIGSGHVMRCLVLADILKTKGNEISFVMRPQEKDLIEYVQVRGFEVIKLRLPKDLTLVQDENDYSTWLLLNEEEDALDFIEKVQKIDFVVVDHYGINDIWEIKVKEALKCSMLAIDDLVRKHSADLILDQTLGRNSEEYSHASDCVLAMTGTRYALLRKEFSSFRHDKFKLDKTSISHNILISMGAIDNLNVTLKVLIALKKSNMTLNCTVLLNTTAPHFHVVNKFIKNNSHWVKHISFTENIAQLMMEHTISIGAPGATSWERVCLGIPSIVIPIALNQKDICEQLIKHRCALAINICNIDSNLAVCVNNLIDNYVDMRDACLRLCDGGGAQRVSEIISIFDNKTKLRRASYLDIDTVYKWQTIPETRKYANDPSIPNFERHNIWMSEKLISKNNYFYIINFEDIDIGVVRLDKKSVNIYIISIFITPEYHGNGIASKVLSYLNILFPSIKIEATVKSQNLRSRKLFSKAGYKQISDDLFLRGKIKTR